MSKRYFIGLLFVILSAGCTQQKTDNTNLVAVKDSIMQLTNNTAKNITAKGPIGWLDVFENSADFYMANDGTIALKDYPSAEKFIRDTLVEKLQKIKLDFSDIRVTPLSAESGTVGAVFNENLIFSQDTTIPMTGYFTATAHHTTAGWKYINLHWSSKK